MDFEKRDFLVGLFVLTAGLIFFLSLGYVNRARFTEGKYNLEVRLSGIEGIDKGAEVIYRGYKAGAVDKVTILYEPDVHFIVRLAVKEEIRLSRGTKVYVRNKGFGSSKFLEFVAPEEQTGDLIPPDSRLLAVTDMDLLTKANQILGRVQKLVQNFQKGETGKHVQETVVQARSVVDNLDKSLANLNKMITENRVALKSSVENLERATANGNRLMEESKKLVQENNAAIKGTLDNLNKTMSHVPDIAVNLEEVSAELKRNPWRLLRKGEPKQESPPLDHDHSKKD